MNKYKVSLQRKGDDYPAYYIDSEGWSEEVAIFEARKFVAEYGSWPNSMSITNRMQCLTAVEVVKIDVDKCQFYVDMDKISKGKNKVKSLCMAYGQSKRSDGRNWANYPECEDKNCPLKHPELLVDGDVVAILKCD